MSNEAAGRTRGEGNGEMEGSSGKELLRAGSCRPPAAASGAASMHSEGTATERVLLYIEELRSGPAEERLLVDVEACGVESWQYG